MYKHRMFMCTLCQAGHCSIQISMLLVLKLIGLSPYFLHFDASNSTPSIRSTDPLTHCHLIDDFLSSQTTITRHASQAVELAQGAQVALLDCELSHCGQGVVAWQHAGALRMHRCCVHGHKAEGVLLMVRVKQIDLNAACIGRIRADERRAGVKYRFLFIS